MRQAVAGSLRVRIRERGAPLDFSHSAFAVPIVTRRVADIFEKYAPDAVQRLPIKVGDLAEELEVLNVTRTVDVLDFERGRYSWWRPEDGRSDKIGALRSVYQMVFRRDVHPPPHVFRVKGWEVVLVVSGTLMEALGSERLRGAKFYPIEQ